MEQACIPLRKSLVLGNSEGSIFEKLLKQKLQRCKVYCKGDCRSMSRNDVLIEIIIMSILWITSCSESKKE